MWQLEMSIHSLNHAWTFQYWICTSNTHYLLFRLVVSSNIIGKFKCFAVREKHFYCQLMLSFTQLVNPFSIDEGHSIVSARSKVTDSTVLYCGCLGSKYWTCTKLQLKGNHLEEAGGNLSWRNANTNPHLLYWSTW